MGVVAGDTRSNICATLAQIAVSSRMLLIFRILERQSIPPYVVRS